MGNKNKNINLRRKLFSLIILSNLESFWLVMTSIHRYFSLNGLFCFMSVWSSQSQSPE